LGDEFFFLGIVLLRGLILVRAAYTLPIDETTEGMMKKLFWDGNEPIDPARRDKFIKINRYLSFGFMFTSILFLLILPRHTFFHDIVPFILFFLSITLMTGSGIMVKTAFISVIISIISIVVICFLQKNLSIVPLIWFFILFFLLAPVPFSSLIVDEREAMENNQVVKQIS
jgi:hypothetical protein